jgi:hypothetical protein
MVFAKHPHGCGKFSYLTAAGDIYNGGFFPFQSDVD